MFPGKGLFAFADVRGPVWIIARRDGNHGDAGHGSVAVAIRLRVEDEQLLALEHKARFPQPPHVGGSTERQDRLWRTAPTRAVPFLERTVRPVRPRYEHLVAITLRVLDGGETQIIPFPQLDHARVAV